MTHQEGRFKIGANFMKTGGLYWRIGPAPAVGVLPWTGSAYAGPHGFQHSLSIGVMSMDATFTNPNPGGIGDLFVVTCTTFARQGHVGAGALGATSYTGDLSWTVFNSIYEYDGPGGTNVEQRLEWAWAVIPAGNVNPTIAFTINYQPFGIYIRTAGFAFSNVNTAGFGSTVLTTVAHPTNPAVSLNSPTNPTIAYAYVLAGDDLTHVMPIVAVTTSYDTSGTHYLSPAAYSNLAVGGINQQDGSIYFSPAGGQFTITWTGGGTFGSTKIYMVELESTG